MPGLPAHVLEWEPGSGATADLADRLQCHSDRLRSALTLEVRIGLGHTSSESRSSFLRRHHDGTG